MYLKVYYYGADKKTAQLSDVEAALVAGGETGLQVDLDLGYPCVEFPKNASHGDLERVRKILQGAGFETE